MVWNTIQEGKVKSHEAVESGAPGASLFVPFLLKKGEEKTIRLMTVWYVPDSDLHIGDKLSNVGFNGNFPYRDDANENCRGGFDLGTGDGW